MPQKFGILNTQSRGEPFSPRLQRRRGSMTSVMSRYDPCIKKFNGFLLEPVFFVRNMAVRNQNQLNGEIRDREVRVISETGEMLGVMSSREALHLAEEADLDLVKISPNAVPPVCKIMDYGKFKFEQAKKEKENRRNQKIVELKEVQLSMTIDVGDLNVKAKQATKFLEQGNKVKVTIRLRGRQMAHANLAKDVIMKFCDGLKEISVIEKPLNMEGRNLILILAPSKK